MNLRDMADKRGAGTFYFDPRRIKEIPGYNVRDMEAPETQAHIRKMAESIKANGNVNFPPIKVYADGEDIFVTAGHCRRRAHILAMEEGAPSMHILCMNAGKPSQEDLALDLLTSNDQLQLTPIAKAIAVKRLMSFSWSASEIAKKLGCSVQAIYDLEVLLQAPSEVKEAVQEGKISATLAVSSMRKHGPDASAKVAAALTKAKESGKKKVTPKDMAPRPLKQINWAIVGPNLNEVLKEICNTPIKSPKMVELITKANGMVIDA